MITLIYPYRNRSIERIKRSLDSLKGQSNTDFEVKFIDYGSNESFADQAKQLVASYGFAEYTYSHTQCQPWNKCRALNIIIKDLATEYCFVADVDMLYATHFIAKLHEVKNMEVATYFQVGYLSEDESAKDIAFSDYVPKFLSTNEATGLTLFPVKKLKEVNGFDEFFHFWGAEDTDMHHRLRNHGMRVKYYDQEVLILHQWHKSYLSDTRKDFSKELVLTGIEHLNHAHKDKNKALKVTKVNPNGWGESMSESDFIALKELAIDLEITNNIKDIDHLLHSLLPSRINEYLSIQITDSKETSLKDEVKKILGKSVNRYYSMQKVNDLLLMQLIAHYRNKNYIYEVSKDAHKITLKIKL